MKITVEKTNLEKALKQTIYEKKSAIPILTTILLEVENETLTIKGTNLEQYTTISKKTLSTEKEGKVCIFGKTIENIIKVLPEEIVEISLEDDKLKIKAGKTKYKIPTISTEDFPTFEPAPEPIVSLPKIEIEKGIEKTIYASATDERPNLNGICIEITENKVNFIATDGARLSLYTTETETINENNVRIFIPQKAMIHLKNILKDLKNENEEIKIATTNNSIFFIGKDFIMESRLLSYEFPQYKEIVELTLNNSEHKIEIDKEEFKESVTRITVAEDDTIKKAIITIKDNLIILSSSEYSEVKAEEEIYLPENTGIEEKIGLNSKYITDALKSKESEKILFKFKDRNNPVIIQEPDNYNQIDIIMPLAIE